MKASKQLTYSPAISKMDADALFLAMCPGVPAQGSSHVQEEDEPDFDLDREPYAEELEFAYYSNLEPEEEPYDNW